MSVKRVFTPLTDEAVEDLEAGDAVLVSGVLYQARDAAHKRFAALLAAGEQLPFDLSGAVVFYFGPTPSRPGRVIGSVSPTTSGRMDAYTPLLLEHGLKGMIGKGLRSDEVKAAMQQHKAVYMAATAGAGALLARQIRAYEIIAWPELGAEAVGRLEVVDLPAVVVNDCHGGDLYLSRRARYARGL